MDNNENNFEKNEFDMVSDTNIPTNEEAETSEQIVSDNESGNALTSEEDDSKNKGKGFMSEMFEWVQAIAVAIVIAMFLRTFIFTMVNVKGSSMEPNIHEYDRLVVWRLGYEPKVGDIIVFRPRNDPVDPYIKRVIAVGGQTVDIRVGTNNICDVYVDGQKLDETYIKEPVLASMLGDQQYPLVVPTGNVFAMGDNRNHSFDSRRKTVGIVDNDSIIGHALCRFWPLNSIGKLNQ